RLRTVSAEKPFHFVLALGKPSGLALTRFGLTSDVRTKAKGMRTGAGKILEGTCHGEGVACVFVLETKPPAGLAANIRNAALAHAGQRIKVKVRGPGIELDDETDAEDVEVQDDGGEEALRERIVRAVQALNHYERSDGSKPEVVNILKNQLARAN